MQLVKETEPGVLRDLHNALAAVNEPVFVYDRNYVADYLGWNDLVLDTSMLGQQPSGDVGNIAAESTGLVDTHLPKLGSGQIQVWFSGSIMPPKLVNWSTSWAGSRIIHLHAATANSR